jgi:hypothetical protein
MKKPFRLWSISLPTVVATLLMSPSLGTAQAPGLGFDMKWGYSEIGGDWGEVLTDGTDWEFDIFYGLEHVRLGWGLNMVSYDLTEELGEIDSASQVGMQFSLAYPFRQISFFRPYLEARLTWDRFRPEEHVEGFPDEEEEGENNAPTYSGWGGTAVGGLMIPFTPTVLADVSARYGVISTSEADLGYLGLPTVSSGNRWGVRVGLVWYP